MIETVKSTIQIGLFLLLIFSIDGCGSYSENSVPVVRLSNQIKYSENPSYYFVRPGDTLYSIAWSQSLDYRELASKNRIPSPYTIRIGQKLKVQFDNKNFTQRPIKNLRINRQPVTPAIIRKSPDISAKTTQKHPVKNKTVKHIKINLKKAVTKWLWPVKGKVVVFFSQKRGGNKGIDIQTTRPEPVRAIADGKVVYSGQGIRGYGRLVIIKHNDDYLSAYAYNSHIRVAEKDIIKAGQFIADTGLDGLKKNKLHLEIRFRGKPVNPRKYLPKR